MSRIRLFAALSFCLATPLVAAPPEPVFNRTPLVCYQQDHDARHLEAVREEGGDRVELRLPMTLRTTRWYGWSVAVERGPLVFGLRIEEDWQEVTGERPEGVPADAMHRGYLECRPRTPWNYALSEAAASRPAEHFRVEVAATIPDNPWTLDTAPVVLHGEGVRLPEWLLSRNSAAPPPLSPVEVSARRELEPIRLVPYGATILRISEFPWFKLGPRR